MRGRLPTRDADPRAPTANGRPSGLRRAAGFGLGLAGVLLVGALDHLTGYEFSLSFLYLGPVLAVTWTLGRRAGLTWSAIASSPRSRAC